MMRYVCSLYGGLPSLKVLITFIVTIDLFICMIFTAPPSYNYYYTLIAAAAMGLNIDIIV